MIENDPHGLILSAVAICTVLLCLAILWGAYTLIGRFFIAREHRSAARRMQVPDGSEDARIAAAIATAIELYLKENGNTQAITFDSPARGPWADPSRNFRNFNRK